MIKNEKGFTLVEVLAVMTIIGLLMVFLVPNLDGLNQGTRINVVETDFRTMKTGIQQHFIDNREADFTEEEMKAYLDFNFVKDTNYTHATIVRYKTTIKQDPWGNSYYMYVNNAGNRYVLLQSYGPDEKSSVNLTANDFGDDIVFIFYPKN